MIMILVRTKIIRDHRTKSNRLITFLGLRDHQFGISCFMSWFYTYDTQSVLCYSCFPNISIILEIKIFEIQFLLEGV